RATRIASCISSKLPTPSTLHRKRKRPVALEITRERLVHRRDRHVWILCPEQSEINGENCRSNWCESPGWPRSEKHTSTELPRLVLPGERDRRTGRGFFEDRTDGVLQDVTTMPAINLLSGKWSPRAPSHSFG